MPGKDTASNAVNAVSYNAQLARKVAQAQLKRRSLKRELTTAETQLAQVTLYLAEQGSVSHPEIEEPVRRARLAQAVTGSWFAMRFGCSAARILASNCRFLVRARMSGICPLEAPRATASREAGAAIVCLP